MYRIRIWQFVGMVLALLGFVQPVPAQGSFHWTQLIPPSSVPSPRLVGGYGRLPLSFEANGGQTDRRVKFLSRGPGYSLFLTGDEAVVALRQGRPKLGSQKQGEENFFSTPGAFHGLFDLSPVGSSDKSELNAQGPTLNPESHPPAVIRLTLLGGNLKAKVEGLDELPGKSNYFIGNDPKNWRTNLTTYARVEYHDIYAGIDLVYYGNQDGQLEYDFIVAPGADPKAIALQVQIENSKFGNRECKIDANGDLVVELDSGEIRFHRPAIYQPQSLAAGGDGAASAGNRQSSTDNRRSVDGRFVLLANNRVGFEVASYDKSKPIIIDPTLVYSTYLGGAAATVARAWPWTPRVTLT